jgi:hypothetical protein
MNNFEKEYFDADMEVTRRKLGTHHKRRTFMSSEGSANASGDCCCKLISVSFDVERWKRAVAVNKNQATLMVGCFL